MRSVPDLKTAWFQTPGDFLTIQNVAKGYVNVHGPTRHVDNNSVKTSPFSCLTPVSHYRSFSTAVTIILNKT